MASFRPVVDLLHTLKRSGWHKAERYSPLMQSMRRWVGPGGRELFVYPAKHEYVIGDPRSIGQCAAFELEQRVGWFTASQASAWVVSP